VIDFGELARSALELDPAAVKKSTSLASMVMSYGISLEPSGDGRLIGKCPFHHDTRPSFCVWVWEGVEWWGCWSCGRRGDLYDFLQEWHWIGFRRALELAVQLRDSGTLPEVVIPETSGGRVGPPDFDGILSVSDVDRVLIARLLADRGIDVPVRWLCEQFDNLVESCPN